MPIKNTEIAGIFFVALVFVAAAATPAIAADTLRCVLSQDKLDELTAIQNDTSLDYLTEIKLELAIRKQLLGQTMDCAIMEVENIKADLSDVTVNDPLMQNLKNRLMGQLDNAGNYFALQKSKINDLGLRGSKDFAKDINEWRDGNYKPTAKNVNSLLVWTNNRGLFQSAETRINQISKTMTLLKIVSNDEIQNLWNEAQTNFGNALKENAAAKTSLGEFAPSEESSGHIKSSLDYLSLAYKNFLNLADTLNKFFIK